ncbi:MAG: hypothetical protein ACXW3P_00540 [Rhodospirillales bacterium]
MTRRAVEEQRVTPELARARGERLASFTHFLDIPILLVIVSLAGLRPDTWTQFVIASAVAVAAAMVLNSIIPRLYPWSGEEPRSPSNGGTGALGAGRPRAC